MDYTKMSHASLVEELTRRDRGEALTHTEKAVQQSKNIESLKPNLPLEFAPAVPLVVGLEPGHPGLAANPNPNFVPNTNQPNPLVVGQTNQPIGSQGVNSATEDAIRKDEARLGTGHPTQVVNQSNPIGGQSGVSTPIKNNPLVPNPLDPTKHETTKP